MGKWSQLAGDVFLDWLAVPPGRRWLDVGCGNGAFTELVIQRCSPSAVVGIDPSDAQLAHARARLAPAAAEFRQGDAMALPIDGRDYDVAVMPLVIFFVPDPAKGVAELARVVKPGGIVSAYAWDMAGGGFPYSAVLDELRAMDVAVPHPPREEASRLDVMHELWSGAGLTAIETRVISVQRTFVHFDDYWATILGSPSAGKSIGALPSDARLRLRARLEQRLPAGSNGAITCSASANAVKGRSSDSTNSSAHGLPQ